MISDDETALKDCAPVMISLTQVRGGNREEAHRLHLDEEVLCPQTSDGIAYDQPCKTTELERHYDYKHLVPC